MKKLKENVHAIQVGCQNRRGAHLDKDCPLNKEVKSIEEAKYDEFRRPLPFSNGDKYHMETSATREYPSLIYTFFMTHLLAACSIYKEVKFKVSSTCFHVEARFFLGVTTLVMS
nr:hypothetical protein [Tanacetum cinerariifolium]